MKKMLKKLVIDLLISLITPDETKSILADFLINLLNMFNWL